MGSQFKVYAVKDIYGGRIHIHAVEYRGDKTFSAGPVVFSEYEGHIEPRAMLSLPVEQAQYLMDALWDCGLRPSEGSGSAGALAATQRHLEDMRSLVFKPVVFKE